MLVNVAGVVTGVLVNVTGVVTSVLVNVTGVVTGSARLPMSRFICIPCKNKLMSGEYFRTTAKATYEKNKDPTLIASGSVFMVCKCSGALYRGCIIPLGIALAIVTTQFFVTGPKDIATTGSKTGAR
ncbi:hypothetical protein EMCRGX_G026398 [Ephydatia muelleri]